MKKNNLILLVLFGIIILTGVSHSQTYLEKDIQNLIKNNCQYDVNKFILDKVDNNRVVMIADAGHGNHIFMQTLIDFLNYWIDNINRNESKKRNLYLILESDSNQINRINKYFSSNNPYDLLNPEFIFGYQFTSAIIEFFSDLRKIHIKIETINKNLTDEKKISFKLLGPEKIIDLNNWSYEKRDEFFLHERDEYSSNQIINLLEKDSTATALIFYGGQHLITNKTKKLQNRQEEGYFLGYYLSEHFKGNGGYYSIDQLQAERLNDSYKFTNENYMLENKIFEGTVIPNDMQPQGTDVTIILFNQNIRQPHISQIWSDNLVDCFLNNVKDYMNLGSEFNKGIVSSWVYYLSIISGNKFENINFNDSADVNKEINKWKNWRNNKKINFADEIINLNLIKNRIKLFEESDYPAANWYDYNLWNMLNAKVWDNRNASSKIRAKSYYDYIEKYSKPIIADNLINLLWVGTAEEKEKAVEYLKKNFSEDFNTAKEWTEWWRNSEYCN